MVIIAEASAEVSGSDGSRPVSDVMDPQTDHTHSNTADDKPPATQDVEAQEIKAEPKSSSLTPIEGNSPSNERKHSNAQLVALRGKSGASL